MDTFFKRNGLKCDMAVNGQEAVKAARNRDYDVIFMDCHMPVMDGFEATQAIRKWNNKVRIFAMTAYTGDEDRERCILSGMDGYFAKPVDLDEIKSLLGLKEEVNNVMKEEVKDEERRDAFDHCVNELVENLGFDRETCLDLKESYVSQAKRILSDLRLLAEDKDWIAMGHKLHQLKGASGAVRLEGHRKRAEKAEQLMKSDRHEESLSVVMGLEKDPLFQNG